MCNENCGQADCEICNPYMGRISDKDAAQGNSKDREGD